VVDHLIVIAVYNEIGVFHFCDIGGNAQVCKGIAWNVLRGGRSEIRVRKILNCRKGAKVAFAWERGRHLRAGIPRHGGKVCLIRVRYAACGQESSGERQAKKEKEIKEQVFFNLVFSEIMTHWRDSLSFFCISW
jgi:hypothetical protein